MLKKLTNLLIGDNIPYEIIDDKLYYPDKDIYDLSKAQLKFALAVDNNLNINGIGNKTVDEAFDIIKKIHFERCTPLIEAEKNKEKYSSSDDFIKEIAKELKKFHFSGVSNLVEILDFILSRTEPDILDDKRFNEITNIVFSIAFPNYYIVENNLFFYDKISLEYKNFISKCMELSNEKLIERFYEITFKKAIVQFFENTTDTDDSLFINLIGMEFPLDYIYQEWLCYDDDLKYTMICFLQYVNTNIT